MKTKKIEVEFMSDAENEQREIQLLARAAEGICSAICWINTINNPGKERLSDDQMILMLTTVLGYCQELIVYKKLG